MENKIRMIMHGIIYRTIIIFALAFITSCGLTEVKDNDSTEIINMLINIPSEKYVINGTYNALLAYKGWGELYNKHMAAARDQGSLSDVKIYLLLGFVAQLKAQVATSEAFSSDFYDIFVRHPDVVLETFKQNPYLVLSGCYYIGNYFGFESRNAEKKAVFIETYEEKIQNHLRVGGGDRCMAQILMPKRPQY